VTALDGITVLDLTRLLPGGVATMWLANFGAEVIKIEQPGVGDYARDTKPLFEATNRGKKSVAIDLKDADGKTAFLRLADRADVLVESFRPGVMDRLGCGYEVLSARNPLLVYCAITGYGQTGLWRELAGHDINYIAMAGLLELTGSGGGPPAIPAAQIADLAGGSAQAVIGILLALFSRQSSGRGQFVDVSMMDGVAAMLPVALSQFQATGVLPRRGDEVLTGKFACYNVYPTRDGRWLAVGALESKFWINLCTLLGRDDFIADQYAPDSRQDEIKRALAGLFAEKTAAEWWSLLRGVECCVTPVRTLEELEQPVSLFPKLSHTPARPGGPPPSLGEHTLEILEAADSVQ
jgi:crotonobetainyl-CoA:carnitine CoA-transferase CaiB-like acyl-CoA transferase